MNKKTILICLMTLMCVGVSAQSLDLSNNNSSFINDTYKSFMTFYQKGINEKLYIQTDKPYYSAGEDIWFKGHLVNSITHAPLKNSNFIYVQLSDKRDTLLTRIKIKADDFGFHNKISLPNTTPEGEYTLTAYTKWMNNWGTEYIYNKKINIANPIDDAYTITATYNTNKDNDLEIAAKLSTSTGANTAGLGVRCTYEVKGKQKGIKSKVGSDGVARFIIPAEISTSTVIIESTDNDRSFSKTIYAPSISDDVDVQFYPEGGHLLAGQLQTIVFKATGVDGRGRDVKGEIFNADDEKIAEFNTEFKGMGRFSFFANADSEYYAMVYEPSNKDKKYKVALPEAQKSGCAIKTIIDKTNLIYQVLTTEDIDTNKIGVVIHSRGKVVNASLIGEKQKLKRIPLNTLQEGILTITIIDLKSLTPISERLVFIPIKGTNTSITPDKQTYSRRTRVNLEIDIKDELGQPIEGDFAISVTDRNTVELDQFNDNIISSLLLTSDLQGYIDGANDYFTKDVNKDMANRELLMMTQGWKRFSLTNILKNQVQTLDNLPESEHVISGNIKGFFGNNARKPNLVVFNSKTKYLDMFPLTETSRFKIEGIDYPDSSEVVLQAMNKRGQGYSLKMIVDQEVFPPAKYIFPNTLINRQEPIIPEVYLNQSKEKYYYEGGMRVIDMDAVTILGEDKSMSSSVFDIEPTESFDTEALKDLSMMSIFETLSLLNGVEVDGQTVRIRGASDDPLLYIDDVAYDIEFLETISMDMVEGLGILDGVDAVIYGSGADSGVILIKLKSGASATQNIKSMPSVVNVKQLGYKAAEKFYQPKYDISSKVSDPTPDLRTTLCWDPTVQTDSNGKASVMFYTADRNAIYDIMIEGVSSNGELIHYQTTVEKK